MKKIIAPCVVLAALVMSSATALGATLNRLGQDNGGQTLYQCTGHCSGQSVLCADPMVDCCFHLYEGEDGWACMCRLPTACP